MGWYDHDGAYSEVGDQSCPGPGLAVSTMRDGGISGESTTISALSSSLATGASLSLLALDAGSSQKRALGALGWASVLRGFISGVMPSL